MEKDIVKSLERLIIPVSTGWEITDITIDDTLSEVIVDLSFTDSEYEIDGTRYSIYDFRPERTWRHLDLWQYKTYIRARVPRINTSDGIVSIEVPWADDFERITGLLEKKLSTPYNRQKTKLKQPDCLE
jgi:transposase